ncbi:MAG: hypothetical protein K2W95_00885 [Candidatus Obscuribacterales bacterium]|nr:hypothetical protein [Candidatus Obscuribacterales bacterium]
MPEIRMSMKFTCDNCDKEVRGEPQNKFVMQQNRPSEPMTVCTNCAKLIDAHNEKWLKPMREEEEKQAAEAKKRREREASKKAEEERAKELHAQAPLNALLEQNAQMLALLTQLVVNQQNAAVPMKPYPFQQQLMDEAKPDDKPRPKQRKPRAK